MNGTLSSPGYPKSYSPTLECLWIINVPSEYKIKLNIIDIDFYGATDLVVFDGKSVQDPPIGDISEYRKPSTNLISTSNFMAIRFDTAYAYTQRGFLAEYMAVDSRKFIVLNTLIQE